MCNAAKKLLILISFFEVSKCANVTSNCKCLPYYQCTEDLNNLVTDGNGLFDVRDYKTGECKGYFDVCCNVTTELETTTDSFEEPSGCGYQYSGIFPWTGALLYQTSPLSTHKYKCGISLIHPHVAVTAAHCLTDRGILTAHIGNALSIVSSSIVHPEFQPDSLHNDLALLVLANPIETSANVNSICIPSPGIAFDGATCVMSAWNKNRFIKNPNTFLKLVVLSTVSKQRCVDSLRKTRLGPYFQLHRSFVCAGSKERKNVCSGDGGSPLVCPVPGQPNRYHQVGIVSWGIGCGDHKTPGVYVYLPMFRKWIDDEMIKLGYDINGYRY